MVEAVETIEVIQNQNKWEPTVGKETENLLNRLGLNEKSCNRLTEEAVSILKKCPPPPLLSEQTGLVIGYVQSGKTNSLTVLSTLASENGYRMIIVITGVTTLLDDQSTGRLRKELRLDERQDRKWFHVENPTTRDPQVLHSITTAVEDWKDPEVPEYEKRTVVITVMKHHKHLHNLTKLLLQLDLRGAPVLVVDDEADQASMNNLVATGEESRTYERLLQLRDALPRHSYVQYTATPQAPLLINIIDILSPRFVELLTPGDDYVGGQTFFASGNTDLVQIIPDNEIPATRNRISDPPESFLESLRIFFLGVAAARAKGESVEGHRSMMVHPSQTRNFHTLYHSWVTAIHRQWPAILSHDDDDKKALLQQFKATYKRLAATVKDLPSFDELAATLRLAIRQTGVVLLNAQTGHTPTVDWSAHYSFILIGGPALDRGFTVKGLTVTYMPRSLGVGNADTIQQRARFFGYKQKYLGYCRVFLQEGVSDIFRRYVEHEESVRTKLLEHNQTGRSLTEWKRAFFLDLALRPTRASVLSLDFMQDNLNQEWFWTTTPHGGIEDANRQLVESMRLNVVWKDFPGDPRRTAIQTHRLAEVPLRQVFEELLVDWKTATWADSNKFTGLRLQIESYLEKCENDQVNPLCSLIEMSSWLPRERNFEGGLVKALHSSTYQPTGYKGDGAAKTEGQVTVQLHNLRLTAGTTTVAENVPLLALWIPRDLAKPWLSM